VGLHELRLRNFRLFEELTFLPDTEAITVLLSPNGTGKTSVLEAVYTLATAASFRTGSASDLIRAGESASEVHGVLFQRERPLTIFTPEGVDVVRQGPENRREFLTNLLTDVDLTTGDVIERFARILSQRNALLRQLQGERPTSLQQVELDVWTSDFCGVSEELVALRKKLLDDVAPLVANYYHELAEDDSVVGVSYEQSWSGELERALRASFDDDRFRGHTTIGPQRDDIALTLDGRDTRRQASQGEQRSLALALRLAGHELVQNRRGVDPLLLLDDVFSELDPHRSDRLLNLLPTGQTLVTTASPLPAGMSPAAVIDLTTLVR
jgi:DNA replication and repair protein RecF